ncbi:MAG: hypothetical protein KC621_05165 [Myxococcales bacterium]|nr:hypothetical protein [Myxococcales bacterium]
MHVTLDGLEAELVTTVGRRPWSVTDRVLAVGAMLLAGLASGVEHRMGAVFGAVVIAVTLGLWMAMGGGRKQRTVTIVLDATHLRITDPDGDTSSYPLTELGATPASTNGGTLLLRLPEGGQRRIEAPGSRPQDVASLGRAINERCVAVASRMVGVDGAALEALRSVVRSGGSDMGSS